MPRRFYLDTSAYLCVLLGEAGSAALARQLRGGELLSSVLLVLEARRNLVRLSREGTLSPHEFQIATRRMERDLEQFLLRDLTLDLCNETTMPVVSTPRSLDLAHLRTASWFHARQPLTRFVSKDQGQLDAAGELGLPI